MRRAPNWLVSILLAVSALGVSTSTVGAASAHVWSNSDAFTVTCLGVRDTYPAQLYSLTVGQLGKMGYNVGGALGANFTRSAFLASVKADYSVYVHSHGDNYWAASGYPNIDSAFLQDPGVGQCNDANDKVRSSSIASTTAGTFFNVVIMSACMLGSSSSTMPAAFSIAKTKAATDPEFYLGYVYHGWDSDNLRFEKALWSYINAGAAHSRTMAAAFAYASGIGGYSSANGEPFQPNWWGNPGYDGWPQIPGQRCQTCLS